MTNNQKMTDNILEKRVKQLMPYWSVDEYTYLKSTGYFDIEPKKEIYTLSNYFRQKNKRIKK